ncbi:hypothetical protein [Deinococcus radiodurans]|uniref:hypothetical protein n=1 Tax=Deinococcus radiodurans TaxID=1299 RepID=UPI0002EBD753|nr:hypothetical protein [Deinococcus radiodurans]
MGLARAPAARQPELRLPDPPSPDDVAPAPLPGNEAAPWQDEHAAEPPPAPADAQGGDRVTPPGQSRELYLGEVITEEPDWDSFGAPVLDDVEASGAALLDDAPFAEYSAPRPAPKPAPAPRETANARPAAPARPGDIRAHPMFEDIKGRFSGRVREIGKNRRVQADSSDADGEADESEDTAEA